VSISSSFQFLDKEETFVNLNCVDEGVGRSTTGMVMTYLIKDWLEGFQKSFTNVFKLCDSKT
jgi:hypothetical protein